MRFKEKDPDFMAHNVFKNLDKLKPSMNPITYMKIHKQFKSHMNMKLHYGNIITIDETNYILSYNGSKPNKDPHYTMVIIATSLLASNAYYLNRIMYEKEQHYEQQRRSSRYPFTIKTSSTKQSNI